MSFTTIKIVILIFFSTLNFKLSASDIVLEKFYGTKVHYNFSVDKDGNILIGTSQGTFKIIDNSLIKLNDNAGYVRFTKGKLEVSKNGSVDRHYKYRDLLPNSYSKYWQQSIEKENYIYIICKNALFIFKRLPFSLQMEGYSIRSFSPNSIATYNGVFCFGEKLKVPTYSSGKILEIDSTFYICYDGLVKYSRGQKPIVYSNEVSGETKIGDNTIGFSRDIKKLNSEGFLLSTTKGLYVLNDSLEVAEKIFNNEDNNAPVIIEVFQKGYTNRVTFAQKNKIYRYGFSSKELIQLTSFSDIIVDGMVIPHEVNSEYFILTNHSLVIYNYLKDEKKVIRGLSNAYSLLVLTNNDLLISTINGLYYLKSGTNKFVHIFNGVEFNKMALYKEGDTIKLGSTNGIIKITESGLQNVVDNEIIRDQINVKKSFIYIILGLLIVSLGLLIVNWYRKKRIIISDEKNITKQTILNYIEENLSNVTVESISEHFKINNNVLYSLVKPSKPGKLITGLRLEKAKELKIQGRSIEEIANYTGFSASYLKKLKY